jgi:predicted O-methyltransferase YrrM
MNIVHEEIEAYLQSLTPPRPAVLAEMETYAAERDFPAIGPEVGRYLQQLVLLTGARRVFELGSGFGYSAVWMALAMQPGGTVECTENDADNVERGRRYAAEAGVADRLVWHEGDALAAVERATGPYDIILNDVDKHQYPRALELAWPKLRPGGVMVTDNVLWSGRIVRERPPSEDTRGVLAFNDAAYALPDALVTVLPLRDGLLVAVKMG